MSLTSIFSISLGAILVENFIFSQFLGICPFLGVSQKVDTALGMGLAVTFVMGMSSALCYVVTGLLNALDLGYMGTLAYILIIASLVQLVEMFLKKNIPSLYASLGIYLPLITTNCAVLGVCINNINDGYGFVTSMMNSIGTGLGFLLAMVIFSGVRQRIEHNNIPESFKGVPITLIAASVLALAFMGFSGVIDGIFGA